MAQYWSGTFLGNLETELTHRSLSLPAIYREYAEFFVFDPNSPVRSQLSGNALTDISQNSDKNTTLLMNESRVWRVKMLSYSSWLICVPMEMPASVTSRSLKLSLETKAASPLTDDLTIKVYAAKDGLINNVRKLGELSPTSPLTEYNIQVNQGEKLFLLATNGYIDGIWPKITISDQNQPFPPTPSTGWEGTWSGDRFKTLVLDKSGNGTYTFEPKPGNVNQGPGKISEGSITGQGGNKLTAKFVKDSDPTDWGMIYLTMQADGKSYKGYYHVGYNNGQLDGQQFPCEGTRP
jgi:hypothetical protein